MRPPEEEPLTFNTKIERPVNIQEVQRQEKERVWLFLSELYYHYLENSIEDFRGSNSLLALSKYASGLVINKPKDTSEDTFMCVFDALKTSVEALKYRLNYQNCTVTIASEIEQRKEICYMKPHFDYSKEKPYVQRFGNVKLERLLADGKSKNITVLCTYYSGFNYTDPISFDEFFKAVCSPGR